MLDNMSEGAKIHGKTIRYLKVKQVFEDLWRSSRPEVLWNKFRKTNTFITEHLQWMRAFLLSRDVFRVPSNI